MINKVFAMILGLTLFTSCSNHDFGYNEKVAANFLTVMDRVDAVNADIKSGKYKPNAQPDQFSGPVTKPADQLVQYTGYRKRYKRYSSQCKSG